MPYEWMLILVTAVAPTEYNVVALLPTETIEQCYEQSVQVDVDIERKDNQEMLCIKLNQMHLQEIAYEPLSASPDL